MKRVVNTYGTKIIITTSREPSQKLRMFVNELVSVIPYSKKLQRGKRTFEDLYLALKSYGADRLVVVGDWRGNPSTFSAYSPNIGGTFLSKIFEFNIKGVSLVRDIRGSLPKIRPRKIGVSLLELEEDDALKFAEKLSQTLHATMIYKVHMFEECDVVVEVEKCLECKFKLLFIDPKTGSIIGPVIKVGEAKFAEREDRHSRGG